MSQDLAVLYLQIEVMSPIHIGAGEDFCPTEYVIKNGNLLLFEPSSFVNFMIEEGKYDDFLSLCSESKSESLLKQRNFIFNFYSEAKVGSIFKIPVTKDVEGEYNASLSVSRQGKVQNALRIRKFPRNKVNHEVFIPGSSVKGAIKSAFINSMIRTGKFKDNEKILADLLEEERLSEQSQKDPFRALVVSDFLPVDAGRSSVCTQARNIKKFGDNSSMGIPVKMEVLREKTKFIGTITLKKQILNGEIGRFIKDKFNFHSKTTSIDLQKILKSWLDYHFQDVIKRETRKFNYDQSFSSSLSSSENSSVVKIGQHSGAMAVTLKGSAQVYNMKTRGYMSEQTTFWKIDDKPMGYAKIHFLSPEQGETLIQKVEKRYANAISDKLQIQKEKEKTATLLAQKLKEEEIEREKQKQEAEDERNRRESMSPEEKLLEDFIKTPDENKNYRLCQFLASDSQDQDLKIKIAQTLRDWWVKTDKDRYWKKPKQAQKERKQLVQKFLPQDS